MGFLSDLLFGKETGTAPGSREAMQRAMEYEPGTVGSGYTTRMMGQAEQMFQPGAGMGYLEGMLEQDPFSSQAFQQTQEAMMGIMGERLTGLGSQLAGQGLLRGSGAERMAGDVVTGTMTNLGTQALQAGLQSEGMRMQAAQFLPQMRMGMGQGMMGLGQMQTGIRQSDIQNRLASLGLGMQAGLGAQQLRTSGQERGGGLWNMGMDVLGLATGAGWQPFGKE